MAYPQAITDFAQSVYLVIKNRYFDDISSADGQTFISQVVDWTNQYLDELETVTDQMDEPVNWKFMIQGGFALGSGATGDTAIDLDSSVQGLVTSPGRYLQITDSTGTVQSNWTVVSAEQVINKAVVQEDRVYVANGQIVFSRPLTDLENNGTITADALVSIPRLSTTNTKALTQVKPKQLLVLGVAKNASLPDIAQGGLAPSLVQKYNDLLTSAIARNNASSVNDTVARDSFSYVSGVGF